VYTRELLKTKCVLIGRKEFDGYKCARKKSRTTVSVKIMKEQGVKATPCVIPSMNMKIVTENDILYPVFSLCQKHFDK